MYKYIYIYIQASIILETGFKLRIWGFKLKSEQKKEEIQNTKRTEWIHTDLYKNRFSPVHLRLNSWHQNTQIYTTGGFHEGYVLGQMLYVKKIRAANLNTKTHEF